MPRKVTQTTVKKKVVKKTAKPKVVVTPPVLVAIPPISTLTQGESIWAEIKEVRLDMFGLPGQLVNKYYKPLFLDPSKLHLTPLTRASSALQALETAIASKYAVELAEKYVIVTLKE